MSKRRKNKSFNLPSKTTEKYYHNLAQSTSGETARPSNIGNLPAESSPTDQNLTEGTSPWNDFVEKGGLDNTTKVVGAVFKIIIIIATIAGLLFGAGKYFWYVNESITNMKGGLFKLENTIEKFSGDIKTRQDDMRVSLVKILEKFERLFDRIPTPQNQNMETVLKEE